MLCAVIPCINSRTRFCGLNRNMDRSFIHTGTTRPAAMNVQRLLHSHGIMLLLPPLLACKSASTTCLDILLGLSGAPSNLCDRRVVSCPALHAAPPRPLACSACCRHTAAHINVSTSSSVFAALILPNVSAAAKVCIMLTGKRPSLALCNSKGSKWKEYSTAYMLCEAAGEHLGGLLHRSRHQRL